MNTRIRYLLQPKKVWSREEVLRNSSPVPKASGIYAWYFTEIPYGVPTDRCNICEGLTLLYTGISPKRPSQETGKASSENLRTRLKYHYRGNAYGSTLRKSLGCLLSEKLGIQLQRFGSGKRVHFGDGESVLSEWMGHNAFVAWLLHDAPWTVENELISGLSLPLNLRGNEHHPFYQALSKIREECMKKALPAS